MVLSNVTSVAFAAAVTRIKAARSAGFSARKDKDRRAEWRSNAEDRAANQAALEAFAHDILPLVLKGAWQPRGSGFIGRLKYHRSHGFLIDHTSSFLQRGARGRYQHAWLTEPYPKPGLPEEPVLWRFQRDYGGPIDLAVVPLGQSVSRWLPGHSIAFVIARPGPGGRSRNTKGRRPPGREPPP
jgi:hypothetical protein